MHLNWSVRVRRSGTMYAMSSGKEALTGFTGLDKHPHPEDTP